MTLMVLALLMTPVVPVASAAKAGAGKACKRACKTARKSECTQATVRARRACAKAQRRQCRTALKQVDKSQMNAAAEAFCAGLIPASTTTIPVSTTTTTMVVNPPPPPTLPCVVGDPPERCAWSSEGWRLSARSIRVVEPLGINSDDLAPAVVGFTVTTGLEGSTDIRERSSLETFAFNVGRGESVMVPLSLGAMDVGRVRDAATVAEPLTFAGLIIGGFEDADGVAVGKKTRPVREELRRRLVALRSPLHALEQIPGSPECLASVVFGEIKQSIEAFNRISIQDMCEADHVDFVCSQLMTLMGAAAVLNVNLSPERFGAWWQSQRPGPGRTCLAQGEESSRLCSDRVLCIDANPCGDAVTSLCPFEERTVTVELTGTPDSGNNRWDVDVRLERTPLAYHLGRSWIASSPTGTNALGGDPLPPSDFRLADVDHDGDLDLLARQTGGTGVTGNWVGAQLNDGRGQFSDWVYFTITDALLGYQAAGCRFATDPETGEAFCEVDGTGLLRLIRRSDGLLEWIRLELVAGQPPATSRWLWTGADLVAVEPSTGRWWKRPAAQTPPGAFCYDYAVTDLDRDGGQDLLCLAQWFSGSAWFDVVFKATGPFGQPPWQEWSMRSTALNMMACAQLERHDVDRDGRIDWVCDGKDGSTSVLRSTAPQGVYGVWEATYPPPAATSPGTCQRRAIADLNGDRTLETTCGVSQDGEARLYAYRHSGDPTWSEVGRRYRDRMLSYDWCDTWLVGDVTGDGIDDVVCPMQFFGGKRQTYRLLAGNFATEGSTQDTYNDVRAEP
jgi:hypothetical protein